jgi:hypothetical protein
MVDIPHKLSIDDVKNPDLAPFIPQVRIFLDGIEQTNVVRYDMDSGQVVRLAKDEQGKFKHDGVQVLTEVLRGKVTVSLKDKA